MAQQSIVLLKNEKNVLPLSKKIKKIAVIGPNADNQFAVLGNYNGIPSEIVTALQGIRKKLGNDVVVQYERGTNYVNDTIFQYSDINSQVSFEGKKGFQASYFSNKDLSGEPVLTRLENGIDYNWQEGEMVADKFKAYSFSARWTADFKADKTGRITFEVEGDDGYRLLIDGKEVLTAWTRNRGGTRIYNLEAEKDKVYRVVLEYFQNDGKATVKLKAGNFIRSDFNALATRVKDADAIIFVGGISPQLEGEEMRVNQPGFNGGDRTSILLPAVQTDLMKSLKSTGKPVVFVMMTGSAIAIPWEAENVPAILNAWYGGQSAGTAIADVLFGDYNPAGRLPVTFYKSDADLPDFNDYSMNNRTYRYFKGQALYPFGYGLSYTTFSYDQLTLPPTAIAGKTVRVSARVTNAGKRDGEEVVQVYVSHPGVAAAPVRALKGFQRIFLKAGESKLIQFDLRADDLSVVDENGKLVQPAGKISISVGGGQPNDADKARKKVAVGDLALAK
jgi:beta-glucosidase